MLAYYIRRGLTLRPKLPGNYVLGWRGCVLGPIVSSLPVVVTSELMNTMHGLLDSCQRLIGPGKTTV